LLWRSFRVDITVDSSSRSEKVESVIDWSVIVEAFEIRVSYKDENVDKRVAFPKGPSTFHNTRNLALTIH